MKTTTNKCIRHLPVVFVAFAITAASLQAATLLHEFTFNDPANGNITASTGTLGGSASFTSYVETGSIARQSADLHGTNGSGVSGKTGDYAFDNTASTRMGGAGASNGATAGYGGIATIDGGSASFVGLNSFTISGWYNTASETTPGSGARLLEIGNLGIWFQSGSELRITVPIKTEGEASATSNVLKSDAALLFTADTWIFFAVTFDGVTGKLTLYAGSEKDGVLIGADAVIPSMTTNTGFLANTTTRGLGIANALTNDNQRPFDGLLDNFRIWGETSGSDGALSKTELQTIMRTDLGLVPEPASTAALIGMSLLVAAMIWRRQQK